MGGGSLVEAKESDAAARLRGELVMSAAAQRLILAAGCRPVDRRLGATIKGPVTLAGLPCRWYG
ncbi:hypothetical protein [Paludibacterium denitrificans]|uniref:Uncharacterized protein n=1 Tax=Paludibacterium denitrificans TaxID=2675226 RepID=A0A844G908_9NEIS|nr:hypothetical protein [Paludibacterium denitrificans]MTD32272.1 hypothetical protein [Paludibacterium denitrificans]